MQVTTRINPEQRWQLLQLTPKLEQSLKNGELTLKSDGTSVFVCTQDSTHYVRLLKQSNTLMLTAATADGLQAFAAPTEMLETVQTPGSVKWELVPVYSGIHASVPPAEPIELACSIDEYRKLSREKPVVELNGGTYVVSPDVVHDVLVEVVSSMVEAGDLDLKSPINEVKLQIDEPLEVVLAVYNMFLSRDTEAASLDIAKMARWTGTYILKRYPQGIAVPEFVREWSQDLPVRIKTNVGDLVGAVETRPRVLRHVDRAALAGEPRDRFAQLFRVKREWLMSDIEPFVEDLVPLTQKLENWILKYARKTRKGKDFVVSARKL